ncbi:MAG: L,D-transpeptidase/peptidoglycan binding protein [Lachnospiraceae bacterium]|nr:L,D-transpeptidase/peptidoglycan binding protein [Lachnospiraceae bacterium]
MKKLALGVLAAAFLLAGLLSWRELASGRQQNTVIEEPTQEVTVVLQQIERYAEGSTINGINVSGLLPSEAIAAVETAFLSRSITIKMGTEQYDFSYSGLNCDFSGFEVYVMTNRPNESIATLEYEAVAGDGYLDLDGISILGGNLKLQESQDASLRFDSEAGTVEIIPEVVGNKPAEGVLEDKLTDAVMNNLAEITLTEADFELPKILSNDTKLLADKAQLEKILKKKITLEVCGNTVTVSAKKIRTMVRYDGGIVIDAETVSAFVDELKSKYDTNGVPRAFTTSTGKVVTVEKGTYGWIIDRERTIEKLSEAILNDKKRPSIKAAYTLKGQRPAGDELQGTYIEVSIENQHVWMYKNGELIVDDDCTTGEWNRQSNHTREGMFFLKYKKRDVVLRGSDYADFVNYWMPYDKSIGMHDASWRTDEEFGGTNYIGNGSHGCVNLRHDTAETIYNNWDADVPIIVW